jgi:hypothetical protein
MIDRKYLPDLLDEHQDYVTNENLIEVLAAAAEEIRYWRARNAPELPPASELAG